MNYRSRILNQSTVLLYHEGLSNFSINLLSKNAQIAKKTIYKYYKNKEEIITSLTSFHLRNHQKQARDIISRNDDNGLLQLAKHDFALINNCIKHLKNRKIANTYYQSLTLVNGFMKNNMLANYIVALNQRNQTTKEKSCNTIELSRAIVSHLLMHYNSHLVALGKEPIINNHHILLAIEGLISREKNL